MPNAYQRAMMRFNKSEQKRREAEERELEEIRELEKRLVEAQARELAEKERKKGPVGVVEVGEPIMVEPVENDSESDEDEVGEPMMAEPTEVSGNDSESDEVERPVMAELAEASEGDSESDEEVGKPMMVEPAEVSEEYSESGEKVQAVSRPSLETLMARAMPAETTRPVPPQRSVQKRKNSNDSDLQGSDEDSRPGKKRKIKNRSDVVLANNDSDGYDEEIPFTIRERKKLRWAIRRIESFTKEREDIVTLEEAKDHYLSKVENLVNVITEQGAGSSGNKGNLV